jgi:hypothetical protein
MHLGHAYFVLVTMGSRESEIELLFQLASHQVPPVERFERQTNVSNGSLFIYFIPFIHVRGAVQYSFISFLLYMRWLLACFK